MFTLSYSRSTDEKERENEEKNCYCVVSGNVGNICIGQQYDCLGRRSQGGITESAIQETLEYGSEYTVESASENGEQTEEVFMEEAEIEYEEADVEEPSEQVEFETEEEPEAISLFSDGIETYDFGGTGEGIAGGTIATVTASKPFDSKGYYPATLEYVLRRYNICITYEGEERTTNLNYWLPDRFSANREYQCYGGGDDIFCMKFYNADGALVPISDKYVPLGEYTVKIVRNAEETAYEIGTIKIVEPPKGEVTGNAASFSCTSSDDYEEAWYQIPSNLIGEYTFIPSDWIHDAYDYYFTGIWKMENSVATQLQDAEGGTRFTYTLNGSNENLYLVIGQSSSHNDNSGKVIWQQKKEISSIKLETADSYNAWGNDIENETYVIVTYADGSTERTNDWKHVSYFIIGEQYNWSSGYELCTGNDDVIYLGMTDSDGNLIDACGSASWRSGTYSWKAWVKEAADISCTSMITVDSPSVKNLMLEGGEAESFSISDGVPVYYGFTSEPESSVYKELTVTNNSINEMHYCIYSKESDGQWVSCADSSLSAGETRVHNWYKYDTEHLLIMYTDDACEGTIGLYEKGTAKSASVEDFTVKSSDKTVWGSIPVTITFVGADGETVVSSQKIVDWRDDCERPNGGYAYTKYDEQISFALFNGSEQICISVFSLWMRKELDEMYASGASEEEIQDFLERCLPYSVESGVYTLKVFLGSIADGNVIGSAKVTVISDKCTDHKWDSGKVTKEATCTTTGVKTYTCTNSGCGKTKTETIPVAAHKFGSWTTTSQATALAAAVQTRTCTVCKKTETRNYGSKLAAKAGLPGGLKSLSAKKGKTVKFNLSMTAGDSIVSCTSSNTKIIKVSGVNKTTGAITLKAVKSGSANLVIKLKSNASKSYIYKVKVTSGTVKTTKVSGIPSKKTLAKKGASFNLKPTLTPFTSTEKITYKTSNKKVATVTSSGKVKAVAPGTAKITVQSGSKKAICTVTVSGIGNVKSSLSLKKKKSTTIKPKLYGISGKVTYVSSNPKVAKVSSNGKITGVKKGKATITVKVGSYSCTCKVTVK